MKKVNALTLTFGRFWPLFQLFEKRSKTIEKHYKGLKNSLEEFGAISYRFFKSREKKLTPLLFGRFWRLFRVFKNRLKTIEKHSKGG
jgi:hypothetical protein